MKFEAITARGSLILLLIGMLTLASETHMHAETLDLLIHIHLTWQQNNLSNTITVTWQTNSSTSGDKVLYDNMSRGGVPSSYRLNATGINYTYGGASGFIHDVELLGLTPDTMYYFICGGDA